MEDSLAADEVQPVLRLGAGRIEIQTTGADIDIPIALLADGTKVIGLQVISRDSVSPLGQIRARKVRRLDYGSGHIIEVHPVEILLARLQILSVEVLGRSSEDTLVVRVDPDVLEGDTIRRTDSLERISMCT